MGGGGGNAHWDHTRVGETLGVPWKKIRGAPHPKKKCKDEAIVLTTSSALWWNKAPPPGGAEVGDEFQKVHPKGIITRCKNHRWLNLPPAQARL